MFVPSSPLQNSLMFASEARYYLITLSCMLLVLPTNIRLGWRSLPRANTIEYWGPFASYEENDKGQVEFCLTIFVAIKVIALFKFQGFYSIFLNTKVNAFDYYLIIKRTLYNIRFLYIIRSSNIISSLYIIWGSYKDIIIVLALLTLISY